MGRNWWGDDKAGPPAKAKSTGEKLLYGCPMCGSSKAKGHLENDPKAGTVLRVDCPECHGKGKPS